MIPMEDYERMTVDNDDGDVIRRHRSPPFPFISLGKAVERARQLYSKARDHPVSIAALADAWGYAEKSSGLAQTAAALIQFGLLQDAGSAGRRRFTLTTDGIRIAADPNPRSDKVRAAVQKAALTPKLHSELWEKYKGADGLDVAVITYLTLDRREEGQAPFSEKSALELIQEYRETVGFAELASAAPLKPDLILQDESGVVAVVEAKSNKGGVLMDQERVLQDGYLSKGTTYRIIVSGRVGPAEIDRLIRKLELDKEFLADDKVGDEE
jgi:hypothetical protein